MRKFQKVENPATGHEIARVFKCGAGEARAAVAAAAAAFQTWAALTVNQRADILLRWHAEMVKARRDLTHLMTLECGKPLAEACAEFDKGVASLSWFAEEARRSSGELLPAADLHRRFLVARAPLGVVGAITPWNFPLSMITRKVAPALAAGCTVVLKPSELTPLTALALAELAHRAGVPSGVFNVVCGDAPAIVDALLDSPEVRKLSFTGSTAVGKRLMAGAAHNVQRLSLELGGNAPLVVFEDADIEQAARDAASSSYRNSGQTCTSVNRLLASVHDAFVEAFLAEVAKLRLGDGLHPTTTQGPLISSSALQRVDGLVQDALNRGARLAAGGRPAGPWEVRRRSQGQPSAGGHFYLPTVLTGVTPAMRVFQEEIFGPITPVTPFTSEQEALDLANSTPYGLAAYVYTKDPGRMWRLPELLQFGVVGVNEVAVTSEAAPFGGMKQSGMGIEHSSHGLAEYQQFKTVCMRC
ncbi:hypothetical protein N2152v2_004730 [Parachlorella kessleri]